jgi:hypothetical protein
MRAIGHKVSRIRSRRAPRDSSHRASAQALPAADDLRHVPTAQPLALPTGLEGLHGAGASGLLITRQRAGLYVLSDTNGTVVGSIFGDYVIGFTVTYGDVSEFCHDPETAKAMVAELHARETGLVD